MENERDFVQDLHSHLEEREWSDVQIVNLLQKIGRNALLSAESTLEVLEYQRDVDEAIAAQKEHDRWAIGRQMGAMIPQSFYEDAEAYRETKDDAGMDNPPNWDNPRPYFWDNTGKYIGDLDHRDEI